MESMAWVSALDCNPQSAFVLQIVQDLAMRFSETETVSDPISFEEIGPRRLKLKIRQSSRTSAIQFFPNAKPARPDSFLPSPQEQPHVFPAPNPVRRLPDTA